MVPKWWLMWQSCRGFVYVLSFAFLMDSVDHMRTWPSVSYRSASRVAGRDRKGGRTSTSRSQTLAIRRDMAAVDLKVLLFACETRRATPTRLASGRRRQDGQECQSAELRGLTTMAQPGRLDEMHIDGVVAMNVV